MCHWRPRPAVRGAGPAHRPGGTLGSPDGRPASAALRASCAGLAVTPTPGGEPGAGVGREGGGGELCRGREEDRPAGLRPGAWWPGSRRAARASPGVRGRAPARNSGWRPHFAGRWRGGSHRLAVFITVTVFPSSRLKLRVLRWGRVGLAMVDFRGHLGNRVCEHRSFLEPRLLVWSLISKTFLSIRAETHRNHFLFMYVDFLYSLLVFRDKYWCRSDPPTGL